MQPALPRRLALASALAAAVSAPAFAQDRATTTLDTVIVTGTRASDRTVLESTSPVDVLTAEDIRRAGVVNGELGSALQALLPSINFPRQSNSGGADHVRAAQLRGLSPDQVLVLVNGKRRHTTALVSTDSKIGRGTTPVDFNAIPVSAIQRIEVLRDGAGAQYGSDAVAGVINVILDAGAEGGALEASYGLHHTDVEPIDRTLSDGQTSFLSGKAGTALGTDGFPRVGLELRYGLTKDLLFVETDDATVNVIDNTAPGTSAGRTLFNSLSKLSVNVMGNLADPSQLGNGIAVAFVATIYGVGMANLLLLPVGNKLKSLVLRQSSYREMLMEGLLSIAEGENPRSIELKLQGFVG